VTSRVACFLQQIPGRSKDSGADDVYRLKLLDLFLGEHNLHQIHDGTLASFIAWRRQPVKVKRKRGKVWVKQVKTKTINLDLSLVRRILNLAARKWRDEQGLTWLETAPLISMLKVRDARAPYPLAWSSATTGRREWFSIAAVQARPASWVGLLHSGILLLAGPRRKLAQDPDQLGVRGRALLADDLDRIRLG
jgi:hypothetical protein